LRMKFYIYALIDPRDLKPFYVGKGTSARRFNHMKNIPNSTVGPKGQRIAEIVEAGFTVQPAVLSWHETEEEAYEAERKKIAEIGLENLTNKAIGGNGDRKIHQVKLTSKQEQFAQLVAAGESQSDAYRATYNCRNTLDKTIHESASRAAADPKIAARIKELRAPAVRKIELTVEKLLERFNDALELAEQTDQPSAMVAAMREMGKLADLYPAEKRENRNFDMTQLADRIQQGRDRLRVINGGQSDAG
jgi:hypothetical protein